MVINVVQCARCTRPTLCFEGARGIPRPARRPVLVPKARAIAVPAQQVAWTQQVREALLGLDRR